MFLYNFYATSLAALTTNIGNITSAIITNDNINDILYNNDIYIQDKSVVPSYAKSYGLPYKKNDGYPDEMYAFKCIDNDKIGIASMQGQFIMIKTDDINAIGRVARGVIGMKLNEGDEVEAEMDKGVIRDKTTGKEYRAEPFPEFIEKIIELGYERYYAENNR